ncbi:metal ABC transporter solute-binding protein, Zn/Mn family [Erwinia sp. V71]|uniref:metal ABC transporter solute-binding protein, Zn/Mn family n=1 Tax=Erwinia sp. V71 TaxID=3369424 RepID=UPI003F647089
MATFSSRTTGLLAAAFALAVCSSASAKLNVVASFSIIGDIASQIGKDQINLRTLVGADSDTHVYEPKPGDAIALAKADVILVNGLQFEGFMPRLIAASESRAVVTETSLGATILRDPAGGHYHFDEGKAVFHAAPFDPHAWQSVANAKTYASNIATAFCAADKAGCAGYQSNARAYLAQLSQLEQDIQQQMQHIAQHRRTLVVGHNAFRYFEQSYGLHFLSPQSVSTESEASAADIAGVVRALKGRRAVAVFAENISSPRLVRQIAAEAGTTVAGVLYSDALSATDGPAASYINMMRHNLQVITRALNAH